MPFGLQAQPVLQYEYFEDPSGEMSLEQIRDLPDSAWNPASGPVGFGRASGATPSAHWARFEISDSFDGETLVLRQSWQLDNNITVFNFNDGDWIRRWIDHRSDYKKEIPARVPAFPIEPTDDFIYVRTAANDPVFDLDLLTPLEFAAVERQENLWLGLYFGALGIILIYNLFVFAGLRHITYLWYCLYLLASVYFYLVYTGLGAHLTMPRLAPTSPGVLGASAITLSLALLFFFALLFIRSLLQGPLWSQFWERITVVLIVIAGILLIPAFAVSYALPRGPLNFLVFGIVLTFNMVVNIWALAVSLSLSLKGDRTAILVFISFLLIVGGSIIGAMRAYGFLEYGFFTVYTPMIGNAIEMSLLSLALVFQLRYALDSLEELSSGLEEKVSRRTRQLEESKSETEILAELARKVNAGQDLDSILREVFEVTNARMDAHSLMFLIHDEPNKRLLARSAIVRSRETSLDLIPTIAHEIPLEPDSGALYHVFRRKKIFATNRNDPAYLTVSPIDQAITQAIEQDWSMILPLLIEDRVVALLMVGGDGEGDLSKENRQFFSRMGQQIAGAVQSADLLQQIREQQKQTDRVRAETEALAEFTRRINEMTDLEGLVEEIIEYLKRIHSVEDIVLQVVDRGELRGVSANLDHPEKYSFVMSLRVPLVPESGSLYRTYIRRKPSYFRARRYDSFPTELDRLITTQLGLRHFAQVPLLVGDDVRGMVWLNFREQPGSEKRKSIERFCAQIAGAVHSSALLQQVRTEKERTEQARGETELLASLARKANEGQSIDSILTSIVELAKTNMRADSLSLYLVDPESNSLYLRSAIIRGVWYEETSDIPEEMLRIPLVSSAGTLYRTYRSARTRLWELSAPQLRRWLEKFPVDAIVTKTWSFSWYVHVPLIVQDNVVAILVIGGEDAVDFDDAYFSFLERMAGQIAGVVQSAELLRQTVEAHTEAEQARQENYVMAELAREANQTQDLALIMRTFSLTLQERFPNILTGLWMLDGPGNSLVARAGYYGGQFRIDSENLPEIVSQIPLNDSGGSMYATYRRRKTMYMPRVRPSLLDRFERDREMQNIWGFDWVVRFLFLHRNR